ncbi:MAG: kelch motif-containing protein [Thermoplasmata archaeon]|nr:kelch motif-containing protein [Thermoplasmata archaeon]
MRRSRASSIVALSGLAALLILPGGGVLAGGAGGTSAPAGLPGHAVSVIGTDVSGALTAAARSLSAGQGPAAGHAIRCAFAAGAAACGPSLVPSSVSGPGWSNITASLAASPACRSSIGMTYDAADGYVLLLDGLSGCPAGVSGAHNDTWEYANGTWSNVTAGLATSPSPRFMEGLTYDAADHYVLMFGGESLNGSGLNDTWTWSNGTWTQLTLTVAPSARFQAGITYDAADGYVLLFGGAPFSGASSYYGDTWSYKAGAWSSISPPSGIAPSARRDMGMAYDPANGRVVLFGGVDASFTGLSDTWTYLNGTWTAATLTTAPPARWDPGLTYDPGVNGLLLFGGCTSQGCYTMLRDTWVFANGTWSDLTAGLSAAPSARGAEGMTYDAADGYVVLFAGAQYNGRLADTWVFSGSVNGSSSGNGIGGGNGGSGGRVTITNATGWTNVTAGLATSPACRSSMGMTDDLADGYVLLFDGLSGCAPMVSGAHNDTWEFANGTWSNVTAGLTTSPSPRFMEALTYDAADRYVLMFGGEAINGSGLNDTWSWSNGSWTQQSPTTSPAARFQAGMAYDALDGYVVLFGGAPYSGATTYFGDTWSYKAGAWTTISPTGGTAPSARRDMGMAYDTAIGSIVLFGGVDASFNGLSDTWTYVNGTWATLSPTVSPAARWDPGLTYDPGLNGLLMFGGCTSQGCYSVLNDTWAFTNGSWTDLSSGLATAPSARGAEGMTFDGSDGYVLLFAGAQFGGRLSDTWIFNGTIASTGNGSSGGSGSGGSSGSGGNESGNSSGSGAGSGSNQGGNSSGYGVGTGGASGCDNGTGNCSGAASTGGPQDQGGTPLGGSGSPGAQSSFGGLFTSSRMGSPWSLLVLIFFLVTGALGVAVASGRRVRRRRTGER